MKKRFLAIVVMWLIMLPYLHAQRIRGGFGHGYFGPVWNVSQSLDEALRGYSALGNEYSMNRLATLTGGGGYGLFSNGILLGGSGMGYTVKDATVRGQGNLSMGAGLINVGYLTTRKPSLLGYPYIGIGGYEAKMRITNATSGESLSVGNLQVPAGEELYLHNQGISFEVGYALQFLTFSLPQSGSNGGFIIGLHAGGYIFVGTEDWHDESSDELILSFPNPFVFAPYLRLTIGGGGFKVAND